MKNIIVIVMMVSAFHLNISQAQGIHFEKGLTWKEIVAKAKTEKKFIFLDCYATWCGPCKFMSQYVFIQKPVRDYVNDHFISFALQMDQTGADSPDVRQNYELAKEIARDFGVDSYPTYLFFDTSGAVVHRIVGATGKDGDVFIKRASNAFVPDSQYYALVNLYKGHLDDSSAVRAALVRSVKQYDQKNESLLAGLYLHFLHWPYSREDFSLIRLTLHSTKDTLFGIFLQAPKKFDSLIEHGKIEDELERIVIQDEIFPLFEPTENAPLCWAPISGDLRRRYSQLAPELIVRGEQGFRSCIAREIKRYITADGRNIPDWLHIFNELKIRFPDYDYNQILAEQQVSYYAITKQWDRCDTAIVSLLAKFRDSLSANEINYIAWDCVFLHLEDNRLLAQIVTLCQMLVRNYPEIDYGYMDTYANILYKSGNSKDAILWEHRAIDKLEEKKPDFDTPSLKEFKITLQKMQTGQKTWDQRDARGAYL
jgi:thioredoxin-related protein